MAVGALLAVDDVQMIHLRAQLVEIGHDALVLHKGGDKVAHAYDPGIVDTAKQLDQIVGAGEEIGLIGSQRLDRELDLALCGVVAQLTDGFLQARPQLVIGGKIAAIGGACQHKGGAHFFGHVKTQLEIGHGVLALCFRADHVVVRISVVLGRIPHDGHFIAVDQAPQLRDLACLKVRGIGMGPSAPEFDIIVAVFLRILKAVLQRIALVAGGEHSDLHGLTPFIC